MAKKNPKRVKSSGMGEFIEIEADYGMFNDYLQYGPQYDTVNNCPIYEETEYVERQRFSKLSKEFKLMLRDQMAHLIEEYWQNHHLIPADSELKQLRSKALRMMLYGMRVYLKDDKEVSSYLNNLVVPTINKILKKENS